MMRRSHSTRIPVTRVWGVCRIPIVLVRTLATNVHRLGPTNGARNAMLKAMDILEDCLNNPDRRHADSRAHRMTHHPDLRRHSLMIRANEAADVFSLLWTWSDRSVLSLLVTSQRELGYGLRGLCSVFVSTLRIPVFSTPCAVGRTRTMTRDNNAHRELLACQFYVWPMALLCC